MEKKKNHYASQLLIPGDALVEKLRVDYIPRMITIIGLEAKQNIHSTLQELLLFLSHYKYL